MNKKRNPIIAFILSFIPPIGQMYNGQLKKGIIVYFIVIAVSFILLIIKIPQTLPGLIITTIVGISFYLFFIIDSVINAIKLKEFSLKNYNRWYLYLLSIIIVLILGTGINYITSNIIETAQAYKIPTGSMEPTIIVGDRIIADNSYYKSHKPKRGDIVLYQPPHDTSRTFIHRCVALENDIIDFKDGYLYINGKKRIEKYTQGKTLFFQINNDTSRKVPKNSIYTLGDNRENAQDSRYTGFIPIKNLIGKPLYIYYSVDIKRIGIYFNE